MMGSQSPAKVLRSVRRMTKFIEAKVFRTKPDLTSVFLPGVSIPPVFPILSIAHVQSINVPSQTQPMPSPVPASKPLHDVSIPLLQDGNQTGTVKDEQKMVDSPDVLTRKKFFQMVENLQWDMFKPP